MSEPLTKQYSEIVGTIFVGGEWQDHDLLEAVGELEADNTALHEATDKLSELAGYWENEAARLRRRIKALEANTSKSVLRRLDSQLEEGGEA